MIRKVLFGLVILALLFVIFSKNRSDNSSNYINTDFVKTPIWLHPKSKAVDNFYVENTFVGNITASKYVSNNIEITVIIENKTYIFTIPDNLVSKYLAGIKTSGKIVIKENTYQSGEKEIIDISFKENVNV